MIMFICFAGALSTWTLLNVLSGERQRRVQDLQALEAHLASRQAEAAKAIPVAKGK